MFNHNREWCHLRYLCRFWKRIAFFLFTSLYSKRLFWVIFWANKGGTPGRLHSCDPFHGFPKAQHFWKTSKISKAPNIDPHNTSLVFHQPNKNKHSWWTNNKMASDASPGPWWWRSTVCEAKFWRCLQNKKIHIGFHSRPYASWIKVVIYGSHRPGCWRHSVCSTTTENGAIYVTFAVFEKE